MIVPEWPNGRSAKLLVVEAGGKMRSLPREALAQLVSPGDLVIANEAATLPASLSGRHAGTGEAIEVRLAGWIEPGDATRFVALLFGAGDHLTPTELRPAPPRVSPGDRLVLGPLIATIEDLMRHPRLLSLRFAADRRTVLAGLARHGRPIQYSHAPAPYSIWDVWTKIAADPVAFEPPSAGFALDWRTLANWRRRGVGFATLTHAAGLSSTGDPVLDQRLPFDEPYRIPERTAVAVGRAKARGGRIVAIGTSVVRALEAAVTGAGDLRSGAGLARGRIGLGTKIRVADAILTGVHQPGESHYELIRAFADDSTLRQVAMTVKTLGYRAHEFGDSVLIAGPSARFGLAEMGLA